MLSGTMKRKKTVIYPLNRPVPVKYRVTFEDYELQQRRLAKEKKTFIEKEHELWFGQESRKARSLATLQRLQRKIGIPDEDFFHPLDPRRARD